LVGCAGGVGGGGGLRMVSSTRHTKSKASSDVRKKRRLIGPAAALIGCAGERVGRLTLRHIRGSSLIMAHRIRRLRASPPGALRREAGVAGHGQWHHGWWATRVTAAEREREVGGEGERERERGEKENGREGAFASRRQTGYTHRAHLRPGPSKREPARLLFGSLLFAFGEEEGERGERGWFCRMPAPSTLNRNPRKPRGRKAVR